MPETTERGGAGTRDRLHDPDVALFARMRWNAPLSEEHADLLLDRMSLGPGQAVADLGCGWGELLMRAVSRAGPGAVGTGSGRAMPNCLSASARPIRAWCSRP
jgi:cyclopropane fatty-acyl-phospholipid synthase-like methyltransferase